MQVILGANHQFLYPESMVDQRAHTETLKRLAATPLVRALDCWLWRGEAAREEARILRESGKIINYNVGDRFGEEIAFPASPDAAEQARAYDLLMREIEYALEVGSKKIVFALGPDYPADRAGAVDRVTELTLKAASQLPEDVCLSFEPTDRDIHKKFLFGPMDETVAFIRRVRAEGFARIGLLIDMCHVPIIYETLESALEKGRDVLNHVHLGTSVIKDPSDPLYGDRHAPWGYPGSEYTEEDAIRFIRMLKACGYFEEEGSTVTFEMRPYIGKNAEESLAGFVSVWNRALSSD